MSGLTCDAFLGGRLSVLQPQTGYRAGVDPVLLAAAVPAKPGERVLELGCGVGVASLCLARRVEGLQMHGVEVQPGYVELARRNAGDNRIALEVTCADLRALPQPLRDQSFDHVLANPPYHLRGEGPPARDPGREAAFGESAALADWVDVGIRRLRPGGRLTMIQRVERLPELLAAAGRRLGGMTVLPVAARQGRPADRVLFWGRKARRAPFRLLAPVVMHDGPRHVRDGEDYSERILGVLRNGCALDAT